MPAQAAVQNQQEVSEAVQRSLEPSVYDGIIMDKNQLQGTTPQQSPSPTIVPVSSSNPPQFLGAHHQDISSDRLIREGVRPKDSPCLDLYVPDGNGSRLSQMSPKV